MEVFSTLESGNKMVNGYPDLRHAVWPIGANVYQRLQEEEAENWEQGAQICDFIVKYGSVTVGNVFKVKQQTTLNVLKTQSQKFIQRILVEAEYCPCVVANNCWGILQCSLCRWPSPWYTLTCVWIVTMFKDFLHSSLVAASLTPPQATSSESSSSVNKNLHIHSIYAFSHMLFQPCQFSRCCTTMMWRYLLPRPQAQIMSSSDNCFITYSAEIFSRNRWCP